MQTAVSHCFILMGKLVESGFIVEDKLAHILFVRETNVFTWKLCWKQKFQMEIPGVQVLGLSILLVNRGAGVSEVPVPIAGHDL